MMSENVKLDIYIVSVNNNNNKYTNTNKYNSIRIR